MTVRGSGESVGPAAGRVAALCLRRGAAAVGEGAAAAGGHVHRAGGGAAQAGDLPGRLMNLGHRPRADRPVVRRHAGTAQAHGICVRWSLARLARRIRTSTGRGPVQSLSGNRLENRQLAWPAASSDRRTPARAAAAAPLPRVRHMASLPLCTPGDRACKIGRAVLLAPGTVSPRQDRSQATLAGGYRRPSDGQRAHSPSHGGIDRHAGGVGPAEPTPPASRCVGSRYPQVRVILSKLTVTTPFALSAKCCTSWAVMVEPSEPVNMIVSVKVLFEFCSFMLKLPHTVRWPV